MDRHSQQIKRERQDIKRREKNVADMSRLRTLIKNVMSATDKETAETHYGKAISVIDKSIKIGLIHKNTGARRKSQVTRHLNSLN